MMNLKKLMTLGLSLLPSILGTPNPLETRLEKHLLEGPTSSSTPNITTALQLNASPPADCPFNFGWSADENHITLRSYHTEVPSEEDKQEHIERIEHYIQSFSFFHSENNTPSEINPRPSIQNTTRNQTTLTYKDGLRFPATIRVKFREPSSDQLSVDPLITMFKMFFYIHDIMMGPPIQISIIPETEDCTKFVIADEYRRRLKQEERRVRIGVYLGLPLSFIAVGIIACCTINSRHNRQTRERERQARHQREPERATTLSFLSGVTS